MKLKKPRWFDGIWGLTIDQAVGLDYLQVLDYLLNDGVCSNSKTKIPLEICWTNEAKDILMRILVQFYAIIKLNCLLSVILNWINFSNFSCTGKMHRDSYMLAALLHTSSMYNPLA